MKGVLAYIVRTLLSNPHELYCALMGHRHHREPGTTSWHCSCRRYDYQVPTQRQPEAARPKVEAV